jgi:hypothetical protein
MAAGLLTWGEERIANELNSKLGLQVPPRTVENYRGKAATREHHDCASYLKPNAI